MREKVFGKSYSLGNSVRESIFRELLFYTIASRVEAEVSTDTGFYGNKNNPNLNVSYTLEDNNRSNMVYDVSEDKEALTRDPKSKAR